MLPSKVGVFDTTLRNGEQAAGTRLGSREKLTLARQLARLSVAIIEAGYPASSPDDFEAVRRIAEEVEGPVICALSRAVSGTSTPAQKRSPMLRHRVTRGIGNVDDSRALLDHGIQHLKEVRAIGAAESSA